MSSSQLSVDSFPAWARFNDVQFTDVDLRDVEDKGFGLVADKNLAPSHGDQSAQDGPPLLRIPLDLVLSAEGVENYAKVDHNFRQLLDVAGRQSTRKDVMIYLLVHLVLSRQNHSASRGGASTPWTEYVKFLPRPIPIPTMWTEAERALLQGTSLEAALGAKLAALDNEFAELRESSAELAFWNSLLWENDTATIGDWVLVDAWYRSRCLELPQTGDAMVPGLDMVNHSSKPTAYYDEDNEGVVLRMRPGCEAAVGEEINISYGEAKPAAEMLFSYGFIDKDTTGHQLTLPLDAIPHDPLAKAKFHAFEGAPIVSLVRSDRGFKWHSPFAHFMCLNEEDGLDFRVLQEKTGERQLRLFWQDEDVTGQTEDFETLVQGHPLCQIFKLRTVAVVHELVTTQLGRIDREISPGQLEPLREAGLLRDDCLQAALALRGIEGDLLRGAVEMLESQKSSLLEDEQVLTYLGSMEDTENEQASAKPANDDDDDFS